MRQQRVQRACVREALVRPVVVVELFELVQGVEQVLLVPDRSAVQQFASAGLRPTFHDRVYAGRPDAAEHDADICVLEDGLERGRGVPIAVPDEEPRSAASLDASNGCSGALPPTGDRQAFLDSRERLVVPSPQSPSEGSGGGLPGEVTHFTGRDGPMAELRALAEQAPRGPVVTIYAIDGMAGVGKTAFARHAAQEFAARYPDGAIWVDLYGHARHAATRAFRRVGADAASTRCSARGDQSRLG